MLDWISSVLEYQSPDLDGRTRQGSPKVVIKQPDEYSELIHALERAKELLKEARAWTNDPERTIHEKWVGLRREWMPWCLVRKAEQELEAHNKKAK